MSGSCALALAGAAALAVYATVALWRADRLHHGAALALARAEWHHAEARRLLGQ